MDEPSKPNGTAGSLFCRSVMPMACRGFIRWESVCADRGIYSSHCWAHLYGSACGRYYRSARCVAVGDIATLIDRRESGLLSASHIAEKTGSISNELLSRMGSRLPIVIKE